MRLSPRHPDFRTSYALLTDVVAGPAALSYGVDAFGWVGFDTGRFGDVWDPRELEALGVQCTLGALRGWERVPPNAWWVRPWTLPRLMDAVNDLAVAFARRGPRSVRAHLPPRARSGSLRV